MTITNSDQSLNRSSGNLGEAQTLATTLGPGLAVIETGSSLKGIGGIAAGRRAFLPWGGLTFDFSTLNNDGQTIMQRALTWAAGSGCGSTTALLMLVTDATSPTAEDELRQTLLESWCYTVTLSNASEPQAVYDTFADNYDIVLVPPSVIATEVGDKLKLLPVGVVSELGGLSYNLGFTSGSSGYYGTVTQLVDNSHYITDGLALGNLAITNIYASLRIFTNSMGAGFESLAVQPGQTNPMIMTLETGAEMLWAGPAPDRRVMLPWGGSSTFDINDLTDDGQRTFRRALEWAGREISLAPIAHWKLDEASGTIAIDSEGGHDGTLTNGPTWNPAVVAGGLTFDGINDHILVPHDANLSLTEGMTFMAWANTTVDSGGRKAIISKDLTGNGVSNYWFGIKDKRVEFGFWADGGFRSFKAGTADLSIDTWYHLAASFDNATDIVSLYVDGVEIDQGSISHNPSIEVADLMIGGSITGEYWNGQLDEVRIYDRVLEVSEISELFDAGGGAGGSGGPPYTELYQPWSATNQGIWETIDLGSFGVPANAVVEVAVMNSDSRKEKSGGVRAVGSSLDRRFNLQEAEGGGVDVVTMHVQTDASSQIQHYTSSTGKLSFVLLGYWTDAVYVERFDAFKAGANASWRTRNLSAYGITANQVVEIALSQNSTLAERLAGLRAVGSSHLRQFSLHEAEAGGIDAVTLMVNSDAAATVEVYAESDSDVDFHLLGYWSTPPGRYVESGGVSGQTIATNSWESVDLTSLGVPGNSAAQFVMSNQRDANKNLMGLRQTTSTIPDRRLDLQEAESGGDDLGTMHVKVDGSKQVQWNAEQGPTEGFFYPVGWWLAAP